MEAEILIQSITFAIVAGIAMQVLAEKARLPSIVFLMLAGILLGPEVANLIQPRAMGTGLEVLVSLSVALILFEGGLSLDLKAIGSVNKSVRNLLSLGLLIVVAGVTLLAHYLLGLSWLVSALFGAIMTISGPTVIFPIMQRVRVKKSIETVLKSEAVLADPLGAILAVVILDVILVSQQTTMIYFVYAFVVKIFVGLLVGFIMGWIAGKVLKRGYISSELKNLVVFAWVFAIFFLSNLIEGETGILAVVIAGFAMQRENVPQLARLKKFKGQLSILFISILFVLISANLDLSQLVKVGWVGLFVVALIIFIVRPLAVFASIEKQFGFRERLFISWIGPKGIVSASIASLFTLILAKQGFEEAYVLEAMVFLTIMITVTAQGTSARRFAKACDCLIQGGSIIVVGANALGRTLATAFKEIGKEVTLVDNNMDHCLISEDDGLDTVCGNALDSIVLENANISKSAILIATTANSEVNYLVCQMAKEQYQIPEVYPAIDAPHKGLHHNLVDEIGGNLAYGKPVNIQAWKDAVDEDCVKISDQVLSGDKGGKMKDLSLDSFDDDSWIPLILKRKAGYYFIHADQQWSPGDILIFLSK